MGPHDGFEAGANSKAGEDGSDMVADRLRGDSELLGDGRRRMAEREVPEHVQSGVG